MVSSSSLREIFPKTFGEAARGYASGFPGGLREVGRTIASNARNWRLMALRFVVNGLLPFASNFFLSTNEEWSGPDSLPVKDAFKRASLLGVVNFAGSLCLPPAARGLTRGQTFKNWAKQDLSYGLILPLGDVLGPLSRRYLLESEENRDSMARKGASVGVIAGFGLAYVWVFYQKLKLFQGGTDAFRSRSIYWAFALGAAVTFQSYLFAKKQSEHSGNLHLDVGRFAVLQAGGVIATLIPASLIPPAKGPMTLFSPEASATNISVAIRSLPSRGFALTHYYAKLQNQDWADSQLMNGIRVLAIGLLPTFQSWIVASSRGLGALYFAGLLVEMVFSFGYWNMLDQLTGCRVLAGKGEWQKERKKKGKVEKSEVVKLLEKAKVSPTPENCQRLHDQMLEDMGSFNLRYREQMPDRVDFLPHDTWLPNRKFTSLSEWLEEMPEGSRAIYGGGLLACEPFLRRKVEQGEARRGERRLQELLQSSYEVARRRSDP